MTLTLFDPSSTYLESLYHIRVIQIKYGNQSLNPTVFCVERSFANSPEGPVFFHAFVWPLQVVTYSQPRALAWSSHVPPRRREPPLVMQSWSTLAKRSSILSQLAPPQPRSLHGGIFYLFIYLFRYSQSRFIPLFIYHDLRFYSQIS